MGIKDLKNVNYKQYLFDYGEKIGLAVAGLVALALAVWLFVPGSGLFAQSAGSRAEEINKSVEAVNNGLSSNKPLATEKGELPEGNIQDKLVAFTFDILSDAKIEEDYRVPVIFDGRKAGPGGRQTPTVKPPAESDVAVVHFQLPGLVYDTPSGEQVEILKGAPNSSGGMVGPAGTPGPGGTGGPNGPKSPFGPSPGMGSGFSAGGSLGGAFGQGLRKKGFIKDRASGEDRGEHDYDIGFVKVDKYAGEKLAQQLVPVRAAEIVAGFPYKAQIEEFKEKLGLSSNEAVLAEVTAKDDKTQVHTFRFLGFVVERRQVDALGRPIDFQGAVVATPDGGWGEPLNLQDAYAPLIVLGGGEANLEKETRFLKVAFAGLTLPKLPTAGAVLRQPPVDEYPDLEDNLPLLKKTVDDLDKTPGANVAKPAFSQSPGNIFDLPPVAGASGPGGPMFPGPGGTGGPMFPGGTGGPSSLGGPPPGATRPPPGSTGFPGTGNPFPGAGNPAPGAGQLGVIPDYCLIRMFDFTIEPGKTYEYRIKVRMANPNYERKDVASQGIAAEPELTPKDWYVLPKKLAVPSDLYFYAVDQAKLDQNKEKDKEPKLPTQSVAIGTQTVLQVQKWVDTLTLKTRTSLAVGDWVIAERVVATRGEPIGRQRVEVPYWRTAQDRYMMATDQPPPKENDKKYVASVEVALTPDGREPILVDFQKTGAAYTRMHPKTDDAAAPADAAPAVEDTQAPEEVLLYTADGKLLSHNAARDAVDADRVKRLDEVRAWIKAVKEMKNGVKDDKLFNDRPGPKTP